MEKRTCLLPIVMAIGTLLVASPARAQRAPGASSSCDLPHRAGVSSQQLASGQRQRSYRLFVPPGYDGHRRLPLVLDLHGSGGNASGQARTSGLEGLSAAEPSSSRRSKPRAAVGTFPVQQDRANDVAYVSDVIDHVAAQLCMDETRVYATGFSGGGRMTSLLGCALGSRLAAIAPVPRFAFPPRVPAVPCRS